MARSRLSRCSLSKTSYSYVTLLKKDPCSYCSVWPIRKPSIDHITPIFAGGSNGSWENFTAACERCNHLKGDMSLLGFLQKRAGGVRG